MTTPVMVVGKVSSDARTERSVARNPSPGIRMPNPRSNAQEPTTAPRKGGWFMASPAAAGNRVGVPWVSTGERPRPARVQPHQVCAVKADITTWDMYLHRLMAIARQSSHTEQ